MNADRPTEYTMVEKPFLDQLAAMGWEVREGDTEVADFTERSSFREVLLRKRLANAIRRINVDEDGQPWLDDSRVNRALTELDRLAGGGGLMETNQRATELLLLGTTVEGDPDRHGGRDQTVHFVDWDNPENNDFLATNQFRVDPTWATTVKGAIIPDIVLFVNGIPIVVVECKSPNIADPTGAAINQLLRYSNQRDWTEDQEGAERLFHYNQFMVATCFDDARAGTLGARAPHYVQWKDTVPVPQEDVVAELGVEQLQSQHLLVSGMLRRENLVDLVRNFTLYQQSAGRTIKIVARYQQYRAVQLAIERLQTGKTRLEDGEQDRRGGIIWHTQGSGKSLTMVFLVRKLRTIPDLQRFKIVVVTDRTDLEDQLSETATLTGESINKVQTTADLRDVLQGSAPEIVFAMIQKYQVRDKDSAQIVDFPARTTDERLAAERNEGGTDYEPGEDFPELNDAENILVLVDEAHRSQASELHANLNVALPNCAKIGFTGTPIIIGDRKRTHEIFGDYIDRYTIRQSEDDGVTVPILYMGRTAEAIVAGGGTLDELFEDMFRDRTEEERELIKAKYAATGDVLEAEKMIQAKAKDMLRVYVEHALPDGFKAQVVAVSRLAAIRYQKALGEAVLELIAELEDLSPALLELDPEEVESQAEPLQFLIRAHSHLETIRRLSAAAVVSGDHNDPKEWSEWSDKGRQNSYIARFKRPLVHEADSTNQDGLAFLCVKSMLLTGFDAPFEQVLLLDRMMRGHELLQAIARVNRTAPNKTHGLVVDYFGIANHLQEALDVYTAGDIEGALKSIQDELPVLEDRHRRVLSIFRENRIQDIHGNDNMERCIQLLVDDVRLRARFQTLLRDFLKTLSMVLPRPEGLPYTRDARQLGLIRNRAAIRSRDASLNISDASEKVQQLIDEYIEAQGIDPRVPPTPITAREFFDDIEDLPSQRAQASAMEHAARHHITVHLNEDPVYYRRLSERLEQILQQFENNWEQLAVHLKNDVLDPMQAGRGEDEDPSGLDARTHAPFYDILAEECTYDGGLPEDEQEQLRELTIDLVDRIQQEIKYVDFWRNQYQQDQLRRRIVDFLDINDLVTFDRQPEVADVILQLARNRHQYLTEQ